MDKILKMSDLERDALKELGNIGTGNAATALSKFINKNVDMNIPDVNFIPIKSFANEVGGPEAIVSSIYLQINGDMSGEALFVFPEKDALILTSLVMGSEPIKEFDEMSISAFKEMSNIITGEFLSSLSKMLDSKIVPSVPHIATDMAQSVLDFVLIKIANHADNILSIKTRISIDKYKIDGIFFVLFDTEGLSKMIEILNNNYGSLK